MKTMGPLPVSTNHAMITRTKQKHRNQLGTLLSTKNMAIYILKTWKTQNGKILMKGLHNLWK